MDALVRIGDENNITKKIMELFKGQNLHICPICHLEGTVIDIETDEEFAKFEYIITIKCLTCKKGWRMVIPIELTEVRSKIGDLVISDKYEKVFFDKLIRLIVFKTSTKI